MLFQKVQQRYTRLIHTIYSRSFIIDQSWNTLQLKNIVLSFHPPFEPITTHLLSQSLPFYNYRSVTISIPGTFPADVTA